MLLRQKPERPAMTKTLADLSARGPIFLVACSGALVPFPAATAKEPQWSAQQALSLYDSKP